MWSTQLCFYLLLTITLSDRKTMGNPVSTTFNKNLRVYSVKEDEINGTARTLQQEELGRYANFAPLSNAVRFKEVPDNTLSGSSHSRGLVHVEHGGYGLHDYDESHYIYGYDHDHGGFDHNVGHHGHHLGHGGHHGYHHKHYDHALAAKSIIWPLAGLAILGTAAALISNPVLLQLGVISGRRRRDTEAVSSPDLPNFNVLTWNKNVADIDNNKGNDVDEVIAANKGLRKRGHSKQGRLKKVYQNKVLTTETEADVPEYNGYIDEDRLVPIPLRIKNK